ACRRSRTRSPGTRAAALPARAREALLARAGSGRAQQTPSGSAGASSRPRSRSHSRSARGYPYLLRGLGAACPRSAAFAQRSKRSCPRLLALLAREIAEVEIVRRRKVIPNDLVRCGLLRRPRRRAATERRLQAPLCLVEQHVRLLLE